MLEGSVRKAGNRVRVTAQLIRADDEAHLWSETYDRQLDDIFAVQDDISREVVEALKVKLAGPAPSVSSDGGTANPAAFEAYLKGKHYFEFSDGSRESNDRALAAFDQAIALDPRYARAHLGRAMVFLQLGEVHVLMDTLEADRQMYDSLDRALAAAPDFAEALAFRALFATLLAGKGVSRARHDMDRALANGSQSAYVQRRVADFELACGRADRALSAARASLETDPMSPVAVSKLCDALYFARRYAEGEAVARRAITESPASASQLHFSLGNLLLMQGRLPEALDAMDREILDGFRRSGRARALAMLGHAREAEAELAAFEEEVGNGGVYHYAVIRALLGDREGALATLERARSVRDKALFQFVLCEPMLDSLRSEPRFIRLVDGLGLTEGAAGSRT